MALSVGELFANLTINKKDFEAGLNAAKRALQDTGKYAGAAEGAVAKVGGALKQAAATAAGFVVAQVGMRAVGTAMEYVKSSAIGMNDLLQRTRIAFTTMLGSARDADVFLRQLADFAKTTPFEFPELITAAQRMKAYGFAAEEVIPLLTDVGNVSAGLGAGAEGINRMTLALGQMAAKGKVQTQELLQLTELGIPAFEILAQGIGKTVAETQDLVSKGQIASDTFLRLFHEWSQANFGGMMEQQSRTFSGALSNISDATQMAIANVFRPFFDLMTEGAVIVADFLESERFARWEAIATAAMQRVADAVRSMVQIVASGDWDRVISAILQRLSSLGDGLYSGAFAAMRSYAQGLVDAANYYINQAVQYIADLIASFLIGHSPPEQGPLSQIDVGGQRVMEAYGEGMQAGLGPVYEAVEQVAEAFRTLDTTAALEEARRGLEEARGNLEALEAAAKDAERQMKDLDRAAREIESQIRTIRREAEDVRQAYDDQIRPLEEQLELIRDVVSLEERRRNMALELQEIETTRARIQALGDPELRAQLLQQLSLIEQRQEEHRIAREIQEIQQRIAEARKEGNRDVDIKGLELRLEELRIRQQMLALVDEEALAQAEADQARIDAQQQLNDLEEREKRLRADILALPLEEQIKRLKKEQQEALKPLEQQLRILDRQKEDLEEQRRLWQLLKQDIEDAMEPLEAAASGGGGRRGGGGRGGAGGLSLPPVGGGPRLPTLPLEMPEGPDTSAIGEGIGRGIVEGIASWIQDNIGRVVGGAIGAGLGRLVGGALGGVLGPVGALVGATVGGLIGDGVQAELAKRDLGPAFQELWNKLKSGDIGGAAGAIAEIMGRVWDLIRQQGPGLIQAGIDLLGQWGAWATTEGWATVVESLASWGAALVEWIAPRIPDLLVEANNLGIRLSRWAIEEFLPFWVDKLEEWGQAVVDWVRPRIGPLLSELGVLLGDLGAWMLTVALPAIVQNLGEWGQAFINWVRPRIPELLERADELLDSLAKWIVETAGPKIKEKLKEWGQAFLDWIREEVLPKLDEKLDEIPDAIKTWFAEGGGKEKVRAISKGIGQAMIEAIIEGLWERLPSLSSALNTILSLANPANLVTDLTRRTAGQIVARQGGGTVRPGELTLVGERGPELVRLPAGATVLPNSTTRAMLALFGGGRVGLSTLGSAMVGVGGGLTGDVMRQVVREELAMAGAVGSGMGPVTDITNVFQIDSREIARAAMRGLSGQVRLGWRGNIG